MKNLSKNESVDTFYMDKRKKMKNRVIEFLIWEFIWLFVGYFIIGFFLNIMDPILGLPLGFVGGLIVFSFSVLSTNRCPYCDMILPNEMFVCPDCRRTYGRGENFKK